MDGPVVMAKLNRAHISDNASRMLLKQVKAESLDPMLAPNTIFIVCTMLCKQYIDTDILYYNVSWTVIALSAVI